MTMSLGALIAGWMTRRADAVILAEGVSRALIAVGAGAFGALALAPIHAFPALLVSFTLAIWLMDGAHGAAPGRAALAAAGIGWCFGFGYFVAGLWWLGAAFLVEADQFLWALPFGVLGLPAGLALFPAVGFALARLLWSGGPARIFALVFGLGLSEHLRGVLFTGFPWNGFGQALAGWAWPLQTVAVLGAEGMGLVVIGLAAVPATVSGPARPGRFAPIVAGLALVIALLAFGGFRLALAPADPRAPENTLPQVRLRVVQPNLPLQEKQAPGAGMAILQQLIAISDRATGPATGGMADVTHLVWPESVFPFVLTREPRALAALGRALPPGVTLLTGAARRDDGPGESPRYFNALHVIQSGGSVVATYDKVHLVPFGEYLPLQGLLERFGLRHFVNTPGGFTAGARTGVLDVAGLPPVLPLICYEIIFPQEMRNRVADAGLIVNVTNDAWFGETSGPWQHLAQARLRAVEFGLPVVRSANSGVSVVYDPYGRELGVVGLGRSGVLDSPVPKRLPSTIFSFFGVYVVYAMLLISAVVSLRALRAR